MKKNVFWDYIFIGFIGLIGLAEMAHLSALFLKLSFGTCTVLFWGLAGAGALLVGIGIALNLRRRASGKQEGGKRAELPRPGDGAEALLWIFFAVMLASQLIFICMGNNSYRGKDMTVEVVGSFLACDGIYQVNPMTGMPFTAGMPSRLKILCLPSLYGSICRLTGASPDMIVHRVVPAVVLVGCYGAFSCLGRALFPEDRRKRSWFILVVSLLLWAGAYQEGMDGFNMLCCGWRGTAIRNGVLMPWLLSLCVRGRWRTGILCVLAEACMVWTLYGCGACLVVLAGMAGAGLFLRYLPGKLKVPDRQDSGDYG